MQASGGEGSVEMNALGAEKTSPSFTSAEGSVAEEEGGVQPLFAQQCGAPPR